MALYSQKEFDEYESQSMKKEVKEILNKHYPEVLEWATQIRKQAAQCAKDLAQLTLVCRSTSRTGLLPFNEEQGQVSLPAEVNAMITAFALDNKVIPRGRFYKLLENFPAMKTTLRSMFQANKPTALNYPSLERRYCIEFVK